MVYFTQNNSRRRTPGGVFLLLVKQDDDIQQEKLNLIFTDDRRKTCMMKKSAQSQSRKAKAEELRRSLSAGMSYSSVCSCHNCNYAFCMTTESGFIAQQGQIFSSTTLHAHQHQGPPNLLSGPKG
jgi:hypothetical protein